MATLCIALKLTKLLIGVYISKCIKNTYRFIYFLTLIYRLNVQNSSMFHFIATPILFMSI